MVLVIETLECSDEIILFRVDLCELRQNVHFNFSLPGIRWMLLQDLDSDDLVGTLLPCFYHLTKGTLSEELENFILCIERRHEDFVFN